MRILILEGDSEALLTSARTHNLPTNGETFAQIFRDFAKILKLPTPEISIRAPYVEDLNTIDFSNYSGFVFTGAGVAWSTDDERAAPQRTAMEWAFQTGKPVWGSCNGMQLAAVVLGGAVGASPNGVEIGAARDLTLTKAGLTHRMMVGRVSPFTNICIHRDQVQTLPPHAVLLVENDHSPVQAFAYEAEGIRFWGTQYHPEYDPSALAKSLTTKADIFEGSPALIEELAAAEVDENAAKALGAKTKSDFALLPRAQELFNWMQTLE